MKWLCKSEHSINDTQSSSQELATLTPLEEDPEHVSYDVESPFTNIPIKETIDYIKDQIYVQKNLKPICTKLIFQKLLLKLASECKFAFSNSFCQQTNGCTMLVYPHHKTSTWHCSATQIKVVQMRRYVDDMFSRRKINTNDITFEQLNNSPPKINYR